jgi:hypothetical protein
MRRALPLVAALCIGASALGVRLSVVTGESMAPSIRAGDTVITLGARYTDDLRAGRIVLFRIGAEQYLHRIVRVDGDHIVTKGDASYGQDSDRPLRGDVIGTLAVVIPTSLLRRSLEAAASFTQKVSLDLALASGAGSSMTQESTQLTGADAQGKLSAGGSVTWTLLLYGCIGSLATCSSTYALRLNADQFATLIPSTGAVGSASQSLARSLRLSTRCRPASSVSDPWSEASDLLTVEWSAASQSTGLLVTQPLDAARAGVRCEVKATVLGVAPASGGSVSLPLVWGPA